MAIFLQKIKNEEWKICIYKKKAVNLHDFFAY